jgi:hypothetical protein
VVRIIIQQGTVILQSTVAPAFSITGTHISMTGSGVLGGAGAGSVKFGSITLHVGKSSDDPVEVDDPTEPEEEPADPEETGAYLLLWVEEADNGCYCIVASRNGETVTRFNGSVEVSVDYTPPAGWNGESIYVVFRNEDGSYTAVEARYDPIEGKLYFMTDRADVFVVVAMDYPGSAFTPDFYKSLAEREEVKALH